MVVSRAWILAVGLSAAGCGVTDITPQTALAIEQLVAAAPPDDVSEAVWQGVRHFYRGRMHEPAWVADGAETKTREAFGLLGRASEHGFTPADYKQDVLLRTFNDPEGTKKRSSEGAVQANARFDVDLTTALLALGRDVALGRMQPDAIDPRWKARRTPPDLPATLAHAYKVDLANWLDSIRPTHPEYAALQKTLAGSATADKRSIALNMERWRWMPDELGARHLLVNIPAFHMAARENGRAVLDMRVVVGTTEHQTPIFSGNMSTIVFSPYWNVPDSIAEGETAPAAARDPNYLARNNIDILRVSNGEALVVDPTKVDWDNPEELKSLSFRQRPGADNALGHVKFLFPNKYDVYLHDTPADALFARPGRAFSHGCVRLEEPEELAKYVLRDRGEWDEERIQAAMLAGTEKHVALKDEIPVHIVYFTVWPNASGGVDSWPDVYGYDAKQARSPTVSARRDRPGKAGMPAS
jgi:murein L,D-transpeptidase YcbB/YkuD